MKLLQNVNSWLAAVIALVGTILVVLVLTSPEFDYKYVGPAISYTLWISGAASVLLVLALMVFGWFIRPSRMIPLYAGAGLLALILGIGWAMSSGTVYPGAPADLTESASHWSGAGLYMVYVLSALAVGSIGFSMVSKFFR